MDNITLREGEWLTAVLPDYICGRIYAMAKTEEELKKIMTAIHPNMEYKVSCRFVRDFSDRDGYVEVMDVPHSFQTAMHWNLYKTESNGSCEIIPRLESNNKFNKEISKQQKLYLKVYTEAMIEVYKKAGYDVADIAIEFSKFLRFSERED